MNSDQPTILLAPDSFKGTLTALQVADAMARGVRSVLPECNVLKVPMADGGEGTAEALAESTGGQMLKCPAPDPLGRIVIAGFAQLGDGKTFAIDAAAASGLALLAEEERLPLLTTSAGTGLLVGRAAQMGARRIVLGVGGTAFVDGGHGMMAMLGVRFLDQDGVDLEPGGGSLVGLNTIDPSGLEAGFRQVRIVVAADVDNPLLGPEGAARVYGPQKGAGPEDVAMLEQGLERLADKLEEITGKNLRDLSRMGAGGGLSLLPVALMGAEVRPGAEVVAEAVGLTDKLNDADLVIVGEGCLDGQTIYGKAPVYVARLAASHKVDVVAVAGRLGQGVEQVETAGISRYVAVSEDKVPDTADQAADQVAEGTAKLVRDYFKATAG